MSVDLIHLWGTMGWFAKGVVIIMAFMSIWSLTSWLRRKNDGSTDTIMVDKRKRRGRWPAPGFREVTLSRR